MENGHWKCFDDLMTAQEAVSHGLRTVNNVTALVLLGLPAMGGLLAYSLGAANPFWAVGGLFPLSVILAWLAWSILITRWRVWAYERVDDLGELKGLAFEANLIWPDGHFLERTEIRTPTQRQRLLELERQKCPPSSPA